MRTITTIILSAAFFLLITASCIGRLSETEAESEMRELREEQIELANEEAELRREYEDLHREYQREKEAYKHHLETQQQSPA